MKHVLLPQKRVILLLRHASSQNNTRGYTNSNQLSGTCQLADYCSKHFQSPLQHFAAYFPKKTDHGNRLSRHKKKKNHNTKTATAEKKTNKKHPTKPTQGSNSVKEK